jgi:IclR family transcriptional regulator, acetate operon repressor
MATTTIGRRPQDETRGTLLTLERGIAVLEEIARQEGRATAKELSRTLGINVGTCYQILRTLYANGYVARLPGSRYGLGSRVAYLIDHFASVAPPPELLAVMRDLHAQVGESVYITLRSGPELRVAAFLEGTKAVRIGGLRIGYSDHPHARASGKCLLAHIDPDDLELYVPKSSLVPVTDATITDWGVFLDELEVTRQRGYALEFEEFNEGVACVSAVVLGPGSAAVGAISISVPVGVLASRRDELVGLALEAGRRGSRLLGYQAAYPPLVV